MDGGGCGFLPLLIPIKRCSHGALARLETAVWINCSEPQFLTTTQKRKKFFWDNSFVQAFSMWESAALWESSLCWLDTASCFYKLQSSDFPRRWWKRLQHSLTGFWFRQQCKPSFYCIFSADHTLFLFLLLVLSLNTLLLLIKHKTSLLVKLVTRITFAKNWPCHCQLLKT